MARRTDPSEDNWHNVEDAKARKKIQDRLAQRARRKRLREAKDKAKQTESEAKASDSSPNDSDCTTISESPEPIHFYQDLASLPEFSGMTVSGPDITACPFGGIGDRQFWPRFMAATQSPATAAAPVIQPNFPMTVFTALYINGQCLGLSCSTVIPGKSTPAGPSVPDTLHPTELQMITMHSRWIDRFPAAKVRDSMITLAGVMDDEEFIHDIFTMPSFNIIPGRVPWDPSAWKIERVFAEKWGYLFI